MLGSFFVKIIKDTENSKSEEDKETQENNTYAQSSEIVSIQSFIELLTRC